MSSLRSKQLLIKFAKASQEKVEKINKKKINKKINQIKYLSSRKKISKTTLKKEIMELEKELRGILLLKDKLKKKTKEENKQISQLKKQVRDLREKMSASQNNDLRKKVEKLSHIIGDIVAKKEIKKEVEFEKTKKILDEQMINEQEVTLRRIDDLQKRISAIKKSKEYPKEKIAQLEKRLRKLEENIDVSSAVDEPEIQHKMLFGPNSKQIRLPSSSDLTKLPIPPPPKRVREK